MVRNRKPKKNITKTQRVLKWGMWILFVSIMIPYLVFCFSYPFVINVCNYETGKCHLKENLALQITEVSFTASYYAIGILAPTALVMGAVYVGIGVYRQAKSS